MLTQEEDIDAHALRKQGWSITAIANHLGRDRKTIRAYLNGERVAGVRASSSPDPFEPYAAYCRERLAHFKSPRSIDFEEELPRLPTGKLYKRVLRERYWAGRDSALL